MRNYRPKQSDVAEHIGTPRNATEPEGTPKFFYPALESAIFWRIRSKFSNIFCFRRPPVPTPSCESGKIRNYRPNRGAPRNTKERRGTLRNLTGRLNLDTPHWNPAYLVDPF